MQSIREAVYQQHYAALSSMEPHSLSGCKNCNNVQRVEAKLPAYVSLHEEEALPVRRRRLFLHFSL